MAAPTAVYAAGSRSSSNASIGDVQRYVEQEENGRAIRKAEEYLEDNPRSADAYN